MQMVLLTCSAIFLRWLIENEYDDVVLLLNTGKEESARSCVALEDKSSSYRFAANCDLHAEHTV